MADQQSSSVTPASKKTTRKKYVPQLSSTDAENYYYTKQINAGTGVVVRLTDGEEIKGDIRWYDRNCITICDHDGRRFLIPKHVIGTIYKQEQQNR